MLYCICGMIGSGKSSFCAEKSGIISDCDILGGKEKQIEYTKANLKKGGNLYHITCFPTQKEVIFFKKTDVKFIWINTDMRQCVKNIIVRNRKSDIKNINEVIKKNRQIRNEYLRSDIEFEVIDLFKAEERW